MCPDLETSNCSISTLSSQCGPHIINFVHFVRTEQKLCHFLYTCSISKQFWKEVNLNILSKLWSYRSITRCSNRDIYWREGSHKLYTVIIVGKICLWYCKKQAIKPNILAFKQIISNKFNIESYIASKKGKTNNLIESGQVFKTNTYFSWEADIQVDECFFVCFTSFIYICFLLLCAIIIACNMLVMIMIVRKKRKTCRKLTSIFSFRKGNEFFP